jgi:hypothetical protein
MAEIKLDYVNTFTDARGKRCVTNFAARGTRR